MCSFDTSPSGSRAVHEFAIIVPVKAYLLHYYETVIQAPYPFGDYEVAFMKQVRKPFMNRMTLPTSHEFPLVRGNVECAFFPPRHMLLK